MGTPPLNSFDRITSTITGSTGVEAPNLVLNKFDPSKYVKRAGDAKEEMIKAYHEGKPSGLTTDIRQVDEHFRWKPGYLYGISGWPAHGKSEYMRFLALMKAIKSGWNTSFYSPESHPAKEFFESAAKSYMGKSTIKRHPNAMTEQEYLTAIEFLHEHFFYIGDEHSKPLTPEQIRIINEYLHEKYTLNITVKDPWNKLKHDMKGRNLDSYLADVLPEEQAFARANGICNVILLHPKTGEKLKRGDEQPIPGPDWWHGGQMWDNMLDVAAAVHRPNYFNDRRSEDVIFAVFKLKNQHTLEARPGTVENIRFAFYESRYYFDNACPMVVPGLQPEFKQAEIPLTQFPESEFEMDGRVQQIKEPF